MTDEKIFDKVLKILFDPKITMGKKSLLCLFAITENDAGESDLSNADLCKMTKIGDEVLSNALKGMVNDGLISHQYMGSVTKGAKPVRRVLYPAKVDCKLLIDAKDYPTITAGGNMEYPEGTRFNPAREKTEQWLRDHTPAKEEGHFISIEEFRKKMGLDAKLKNPPKPIEDLFAPASECRVIAPSSTRRRADSSSGKHVFTVYVKILAPGKINYHCYIDIKALKKIGNPKTVHARCPIGSDFIYLSAGNECDLPVSAFIEKNSKNGQVGINATVNLTDLLKEEKVLEDKSKIFIVELKGKELAINMRKSLFVQPHARRGNNPEIER